MRLFIAEKPSLARAIAEVLPGPCERRGNFIECGGRDVVAWCAGHILELASPEDYGPEYKDWSLEHLPIEPTAWKHNITNHELLKTIKSLLPKASEVVHAGDPDREGQLLVDEVLEFLGYRGPVFRILISDLNPDAVKKALGSLEPNARYKPLYSAALARQRSDWLFGLNLTRAYTALGRAGGYDGVLSVGRVQTPLLSLIVERDLAIEKFVPRPFYALSAIVAFSGGTFSAHWVPSSTLGPPTLDEEDRLISRAHADLVSARCKGQSGAVVKCIRERKSEPSPLPYSLAALQIDAGKRFGLGAKEVLDACQVLYETHRLTTYPRSDCSYLPEGHFPQAGDVLAAVGRVLPGLLEVVRAADPKSRSRAWSDARITAHHAIIPTPNPKPSAKLSPTETTVYELIARRYVAQFYRPCEFHQARIEIVVKGETLVASGREPIAGGWRDVESPLPAGTEAPPEPGEGAEGARPLPTLREGQAVVVQSLDVAEKRTAPPKRFTDATLIQAMTGIAKYVTEPAIKQLLRDSDGIGTPATQAQIVETLHERRYVEKSGRSVVSTPMGRALVKMLPRVATTPDLTALWESAMLRIAESRMPLDEFLGGVVRQIRDLVDRARAGGPLLIPGARKCEARGCGGNLRRLPGKSGHFWGCTRYPACRFTQPEASTPRSPGTRRPLRKPHSRAREA